MNEPLPSRRAKGSKAFINEEDYNKSLQFLYEKRGLDECGVPKQEELKKLGILDSTLKIYQNPIDNNFNAYSSFFG